MKRINKVIDFLPVIIGTISLAMSYQTIVDNIRDSMGVKAYFVPISIDCLIVFMSF